MRKVRRPEPEPKNWKRKTVRLRPPTSHRAKIGINNLAPSALTWINGPHRRPMSALGQKRTSCDVRSMSALPPKADIAKHCSDVRYGPCVDGSELARTFLTNAALVGAAMCSASHDGISVN